MLGLEKLSQHQVSFQKEAKRANIERQIYELPLVYVYERVDFSTTLYGLQIYPETVREALLSGGLPKHLTGKFTMYTKFSNKQDQYLDLNLELRKKKKFPKNNSQETF